MTPRVRAFCSRAPGAGARPFLGMSTLCLPRYESEESSTIVIQNNAHSLEPVRMSMVRYVVLGIASVIAFLQPLRAETIPVSELVDKCAMTLDKFHSWTLNCSV